MRGIGSSKNKMLILSNQRYDRVNQLLKQLAGDISARCIFLADVQGQIIAHTGGTEQIRTQEIVSLLGGSIATLEEAGRTMDRKDEAICLVYRENDSRCLYALNVGYSFILVLIIDRGEYSSRLGTVWYYAQRVTVKLRQIMSQAEYADSQRIFDQEVDQQFDSELDKLLAGDDIL